jgi:hypothetical protein
MKHLHAFYVIGSIGMLFTAVLHIFLAFILDNPEPAIHITFFILYPVFLTFITLGYARMLKMKPIPVRRK